MQVLWMQNITNCDIEWAYWLDFPRTDVILSPLGKKLEEKCVGINVRSRKQGGRGGDNNYCRALFILGTRNEQKYKNNT